MPCLVVRTGLFSYYVKVRLDLPGTIDPNFMVLFDALPTNRDPQDRQLNKSTLNDMPP